MMRAVLFFVATTGVAVAAEDFSQWKIMTNPFPSTGGGGVMIHDYRPKIAGQVCTTDFSARSGSDRFDGEVIFDAIEAQGGILCTNGRWTMKDSSNAGTTPFRVFIKDGVMRGDPL